MERRTTLVAYDITDDKRRKKVMQTCRQFGDHLQYSVYRTELDPMSRAELIQALDALINHAEDQIIFADLGPTQGRARSAITALGLKYIPPERTATIV